MGLPAIQQELTVNDYAYSRLLPYVKAEMPNYIVGTHHKVIAHYLQKLESGDITRLAIFMPPRHGKTLLASQFFSSWYLGRNPEHEIIFASYAQDRSDDVGRAVRNSMLTNFYKQTFENSHLRSDAKGARKFSTVQGGSFFTTSWTGAATGRGANILILDDLIKDRADANSDNNRRKREEWFTSTAYTRLMPDEKVTNGRILLIMTRWAYNDIGSFLLNELAHENWHILNCPAIAESDDVLGRETGDALWPEKRDLGALKQIKQSVGTDDWSALYQQRPLPKEGGLIKLNWFQRYDPHKMRFIERKRFGGEALPERLQWFTKIVISIDTAYKPKQINDPSALTVWGYSNTRQYLIEAASQKLEFPQLKKWVLSFHRKYINWEMGPVPVLIEDAASGQSLIQVLKQETNIPVIAMHPDKSKIVRMEHVSDYIEAGRVSLPERAPWLTDFETELAQFPYGAHDDYCDSMSQYLKWIYKPRKMRSKSKMRAK